MPPLSKRKALGSLEHTEAKHTKQPRLDAFFLPKVSPDARPVAGRDVITPSGQTKSLAMKRQLPAQNGVTSPTLSDEQKAVLSMVVDEGRTIFFTGSAGLSFHLLPRPSENGPTN